MSPVNDISKYKEKISDLTDRFAIKNFVLKDSSEIPLQQSLEESFIFAGFIFTICLKGKVRFKVNYREYTITENSICICAPGQIFKITDRSEDLILESLFLSADYVIQLPLPKDFDLLKRISANPVQKLSTETLHNMLEFHALITKYHRENNIYSELQTKALIFALLVEIASGYSSATLKSQTAISHQELLVKNFFDLLLENFRQERSVAFYADKLCLTPKHLSTTVKKITGYSISNWINEVVIIEIKRMLRSTDLTALQISEELNFPNPSFFGRFFKDHTKTTPLQYKNS